MSAIDVTAEIFFQRLYLVLGLHNIAPWVNCPYAPTTPTIYTTIISRFPWNFLLRMALVFVFITIHQVIWPSPGTLVPWKMRLEMLNEMVIEILNGGEILFNCKFKLNKNVNLNLYSKIPRNSNPIKISIRLCTVRHRDLDFDWLTKISPLFRISFTI